MDCTLLSKFIQIADTYKLEKKKKAHEEIMSCIEKNMNLGWKLVVWLTISDEG